MAPSNALQSNGIHQITMQDLVDPSIVGVAKVLGDVMPDLIQELIESRGGSAKLPFSVAPGEASGEISVLLKQYDKSLLRFINPWISGSQVESSSGSATGSTTAIENQTGTSVVDASTGIASIAVDSATKTSLAYGDYVLKAVGVATFNLYLNTDISGTETYEDDTYKINESVITNPGTGGTVIYAGIEFTAGSSASAFVTDDIATFSVKPVNTYELRNNLLLPGAVPREFKLTIVGERLNDRIRVTRFSRCIAGGGLNLQYPYNNFSESELIIKILQPSSGPVGYDEFINR